MSRIIYFRRLDGGMESADLDDGWLSVPYDHPTLSYYLTPGPNYRGLMGYEGLPEDPGPAEYYEFDPLWIVSLARREGFKLPSELAELEHYFEMLAPSGPIEGDPRAVLCQQTDVYQFYDGKGTARGGTLKKMQADGLIDHFTPKGSKYLVVLSNRADDDQFRQFVASRRAQSKRGKARKSAVKRGRNSDMS
jgi:hypothetical protein